MDINSIRNVFPKDNAEWLNWISQGKHLYLDKQKIQELIDQQRTNLADVEYLDLDSVTKIVNEFKNPTIPEEKMKKNLQKHNILCKGRSTLMLTIQSRTSSKTRLHLNNGLRC